MGLISGEASTEVDAPIEEVWALVENVPIAPEWQGGLDAMDVLERDDQGRATLVRTTADIKVRKVHTDMAFYYDGAPTGLRWKQIKGELKSLEGAWVLKDLGDGRTHVTFMLEVDPGRVLSMLIRGPVEAAVRAVLVNNKPGELKKRIEGT